MFADRSLAERHVRMRQGMRSADAAAEIWPNIGATHFAIAGAAASFVGKDSPLSQVNGFGFFEEAKKEDLDRIRDFYKGRTNEFEIVMNSFSPANAWNMLFLNGAWIENFENVYVRDCSDPPQSTSVAEIIEIDPEKVEMWAEVSTRAFFSEGTPPFAEDLKAIIKKMRGVRRYLALVDGVPAGAASNIIADGAGFLGGAAVLPEFRGRGIQRDLIARRIADSAQTADVVFIETLPGTTSHRNAEAFGFRLAFVQASLKLKP